MSDQPPIQTPRRRGRPKGIPGVATRNIRYICSVCGQEKAKDELLAKRMLWQTIGAAPKTIRMRTVAWVCRDCLDLDPDFTREKYQDAPGLADIYGEGGVRAAAKEEAVRQHPDS